MESRYLTLDAAARRLAVSAGTLSRWIRDGRVPAAKTPGGHFRIAAEDLVLALQPIGSATSREEDHASASGVNHG